MTRSVFLTGGSGLLGSALRSRFAREAPGTRVRALLRPGRAAPAAAANLDWWIGDLLQPETLRGALDGMEVVVHCAGAMPADPRECDAIHRGATQLLVELASRAGVRRFVHVSSVAVYGDGAQQRTAEDRPRIASNGYARARIAAEDVVRAASGPFETTILRPCPIVGAGHLVRGALALVGAAVIPLPDGGGQPLSLVAADDAAAALLRAGMDEVHHEGPFNLAAADTLTLRELLETVARAAGRGNGAIRFEELPVAEALRRNEEAARRGEPAPVLPALIALAHEHTFSSARARRDLGFVDRLPIREALAQAASRSPGGR